MAIMGSSNLNRPLIFDEVRKCWVKATPEEQVRQQWLKRMLYQLEYPRELLAVEKGLKELPHLDSVSVPDRRIDIVCFGRGVSSSFPISPLLLMECKDEPLSQGAMDQ